eukprot:2740742-Rhodomonas_salina.1
MKTKGLVLELGGTTVVFYDQQMKDTIELMVRARLKNQGDREEEEVNLIVDGALAVIQVKGMVWGPGPGRE